MPIWAGSIVVLGDSITVLGGSAFYIWLETKKVVPLRPKKLR